MPQQWHGSRLERAEQDMTAACERWVAALEKERAAAGKYVPAVFVDGVAPRVPMPEKSYGTSARQELAALRAEVNERHKEWLEAIQRYGNELERSKITERDNPCA